MTIYRHYKGALYEIVHDPAMRDATGETFVMYKAFRSEAHESYARHTETDDLFAVSIGLNGSVHLTKTEPSKFTDGIVPLWARPRAMFHGLTEDNRRRFVRILPETAEEDVMRIGRVTELLKKAAAWLNSDDPMAISHAAAEIRNAQRELGHHG